MKVKTSHPMFSNDLENKVCDYFSTFFNRTDITYFDYAHYGLDGHYFSLTTNVAQGYSYLEKEHYPRISEVVNFTMRGDKFAIFSPEIELPDVLKVFESKWQENIELAIKNKIRNRLYLLRSSPNTFEHYGFGSNVELNRFLTVSMQHMILINKFIACFKIKFKESIESVSQERLYLNNYKDLKVENFLENNESLVVENFLGKLGLSRIPVVGKYGEVSLTKAEVLHMSFLSNGYSAKEVANLLDISNRTVEHHAKIIKQKLGVHSRLQLRKLYFGSSLKDIICPDDLYKLFLQ